MTNNLFLPALVGLVIAAFVALILALKPSSLIYDRLLALNFVGTLTVLFIAVIGFFFGRPEFLDIAIVYALINFIGTIAVLKYMKTNNEGAADLGAAPPRHRGSSDRGGSQ